MNPTTIHFPVHEATDYIVRSLHIHLGNDTFDVFGPSFAPIASAAAALLILRLLLFWMHQPKIFVRI